MRPCSVFFCSVSASQNCQSHKTMDVAAERTPSLGDEKTLESLLQSSKTLEGRSHLASSLPLPSLVQLLSPSSPLLLPHLRLLRNLCAGEISIQDSFIKSNGPDYIASALLGPPRAPPEALRAGLQVLGNAALAGEEHRAAVWARLFPDGFLEIARVRGPPPGVCDPLCMVLDTCCSSTGGRRRLGELVGDERGLEIVVQIIRTVSSGFYLFI